jgi:hypothetical protein
MRAPTLLSISILAAATLSAQQQPRPTALIVGHVVDGNSGAPISGAILTLARSSPAVGFRVGTDADGGFVFTGLTAGVYGLTVDKPGYAQGAYGRRRPDGTLMPLELTDGQRLADVKLSLWKFGSISGAVIDEAGEPVVGVSVRALRWMVYAGRRRLLLAGTAPTDDRGVYRIASLPPGEYMTTVPATQSAIPSSVYERYSRDSSNNEFRAALAGALPASIPANRVLEFAAIRQVGDVVLISAPTDGVQPNPGAGGSLSVVPATFHPAALSPAQAASVALAAGEHKPGVDIRLSPLPTARVTGTLTGPGGPAALFPVRLIPKWADDLGGESGFDAATTMTDEAGRFVFVGVAPGAYVARATKLPRPGPAAPGAAVEPTLWAFESITVGNQDTATAMTLRPGLRVTGRFEFDGAAPRPTPERLRQIPVTLEPIDARPIASPAPRQPDGGTFGTFGVPPGRYFVRIGGAPARWVLKSVTHEGRDISETAVELKDADLTDVVIAFTDRPTEITGRVRLPDGAPDPDATVLIFPADRDAWVDFGLNPGRLRASRADTSSRYGQFVLPGDYYVIAVPEESTANWRDPKLLETLTRRATRLRLLPGETRVLDLTTIR